MSVHTRIHLGAFAVASINQNNLRIEVEKEYKYCDNRACSKYKSTNVEMVAFFAQNAGKNMQF